MKARELIILSGESVGIWAAGETPEASETADALSRLQMMLRAWAGSSLLVHYISREDFALTASKGEYTIGSGGEFNTVRPTKIDDGYIRDGNNIDYPLDIIDGAKYNRHASKDTAGIPYELFYNPDYPLGKVFLHYVPLEAYTVHIDSQKPFTEVTKLTDTMDFPPEYEEPIMYNLALRLAPEYGRVLTQEMRDLAKEGKETIEAINASRQAESIPLEVTQATRRWSIYEG